MSTRSTFDTERVVVDPQRPDPTVMARAGAVIRRGGLVAFPTETVYGLGANALDAAAVAGIFRAKGRPAHDPIIVHVADAGALPALVTAVPEVARRLTAAFWPGALTLVLPRTDRVPDVVTAGGPTVAVRCPDHPLAQALIRAAGTPIAAPSANRFSHTSPTTAQHVWDDLAGRIDMLLDGGPTPIGVESTVLDLSGPTPTLLRPGGVSLEALRAVVGTVATRRAEAPTSHLPSPGMLDRHYAPRATLHLFAGDPHARLVAMQRAVAEALGRGPPRRRRWLRTSADAFPPEAVVASLEALTTAEVMARRLYAAMRALDAQDVELIFAHEVPATGLGLAINDRLAPRRTLCTKFKFHPIHGKESEMADQWCCDMWCSSSSRTAPRPGMCSGSRRRSAPCRRRST
ncbi:MAG: L-threonylcarbamoyladenylate synthase [Caldilineaceae bacterium]